MPYLSSCTFIFYHMLYCEYIYLIGEKIGWQFQTEKNGETNLWIHLKLCGSLGKKMQMSYSFTICFAIIYSSWKKDRPLEYDNLKSTVKSQRTLRRIMFACFQILLLIHGFYEDPFLIISWNKLDIGQRDEITCLFVLLIIMHEFNEDTFWSSLKLNIIGCLIKK